MDRVNISIIPFEDRFTQAFERLNIEWLEEYFYVEDYEYEGFRIDSTGDIEVD